MGAIATMLDATADKPTPLQQEVARLGRGLAVAAVVIAVAVVGTILLTADLLEEISTLRARLRRAGLE